MFCWCWCLQAKTWRFRSLRQLQPTVNVTLLFFLPIFHVICHYLRFSIINLISVAWTSLERERGECRFPCSFMFSVYWLIQRQYWIIHIACFPIFFSSGTSKREKKYFIWQLICVSLRIKPRGMEPQWSPCKDFSLTDIETIVVWSVSFSIIWQRHWERIGKILSSNCKHVLKVRGEYQRICLH